MYKLVRRYFGELCDKEQLDDNEVFDEEVVYENTDIAFIEMKFKELLDNDIKEGYVVDEEQNTNHSVRLFLGSQENWNNYIEMFIVKK